MADIIKQFAVDQGKSLKVFIDTTVDEINAIKTEKNILKILKKDNDLKTGFNKVIGQIISHLKVGSKPKREDFKKATKELTAIKESLGNVAQHEHFDPILLKTLDRAVDIALAAIEEKTPSFKGAVAGSIGSKAKSTIGSFASGMLMQTLGGIPMGAEIGQAISSKVGGMFAKKDDTTQLQVASALSKQSDKEAEANGGTAGAIEDVKEEIMGGSSTGGGNGGLEFTNELLIVCILPLSICFLTALST